MSKEKKICPMAQMPRDCIKKECAWWDDFTSLCAVLVMARFGDVGSFYMQRQEQKADIKADRGKGG